MEKNPKFYLEKRQLGEAGEALVKNLYTAKGFLVLASNYRYGRAEVDMILQKQDLIVFIEVKTRSAVDYGMPESFVSEMQQDRILEAANHYLESIAWQGKIRFDIVAITLLHEKKHNIEVFEDAFF